MRLSGLQRPWCHVSPAVVRAYLWVEQAAGGPTPGAALDEAAAFSGSSASGLESGKEEAVARPSRYATHCNCQSTQEPVAP